MAGFDSRKAPRARLALGLEFFMATEEENNGYPGNSVNLSISGMAFQARHPIQKHDILVVRMRLPPAKPEIHNISAKVVQCQPVEGHPELTEVRVRFVEPTPAELDALNKTIESVLGQGKAGGSTLMRAMVEERRNDRAEAQMEIKLRGITEPELKQILEEKPFLSLQTLFSAKYFQNVSTVLSENISTGGLRLLTHFEFKRGSNLLLEVRLPGLPVAIQALGVVSWSQASESMVDMYSTGVRFVSIRKDDAIKVEYFVSKQGKPSLGKDKSS
jgi:Tfp pilus assembly protein PilZ